MATITVNPIFLALTRPPMVMGIPSDYFAAIVVITWCVFIGSGHLAYSVVYLPLYSVGWLICQYDPQGFSLVVTYSTLPLTPNKAIWGVKSYEAF